MLIRAGVAKNEMVLKNFRTVLQVLLIQQRNKDLLITRFLSSWCPLYRVIYLCQAFIVMQAINSVCA